MTGHAEDGADDAAANVALVRRWFAGIATGGTHAAAWLAEHWAVGDDLGFSQQVGAR